MGRKYHLSVQFHHIHCKLVHLGSRCPQSEPVRTQCYILMMQRVTVTPPFLLVFFFASTSSEHGRIEPRTSTSAETVSSFSSYNFRICSNKEQGGYRQYPGIPDHPYDPFGMLRGSCCNVNADTRGRTLWSVRAPRKTLRAGPEGLSDTDTHKFVIPFSVLHRCVAWILCRAV